eukprot:gnl/TRDRNA2_/TRDRNA2_161670_c0_seq2.p1 gnl/TRDRNA2_/TRDRNA2_161670_c0~~gnl/TRDRNA2_/TRDRNA2_161670_c0_seq2.p1  ORF type:complete len:120 (-),score=22.36 gnl/TRDRNA2_/TRDRNA2_161670_c0_seq2:80-439(-)
MNIGDLRKCLPDFCRATVCLVVRDFWLLSELDADCISRILAGPRELLRRVKVGLIRQLHGSEGATGGVILGCTEIELLVQQSDVADVPLYRSADLHIDAAARVQAGIASLEDFMPPSPS